MDPSPHLRDARPQEHGELTRIAHAAKSFWGYPPSYLRLWKPDLTFSPRYIERHRVRCAVLEGRILGVIALVPLDEVGLWEVDHLWVDPKAMGLGVGRRLLDDARAWCQSQGIERLQIASDPDAEGFYRHLGAIPVGSLPTLIVGRTLPLLELRL
jgi:GNAT superfamily N-acetyltransferase